VIFLEGIFSVTLNGQTVGTVELTREGLYFRVSCRCRLQNGRIHRLYAGNEKIGVLIPDRGELTLNAKVAVKRLKEGCAFSLDENSGNYFPIRPGDTFLQLDKLRVGRLSFRDGAPGLEILSFPAAKSSGCG
jgi:hypothetical protein